MFKPKKPAPENIKFPAPEPRTWTVGETTDQGRIDLGAGLPPISHDLPWPAPRQTAHDRELVRLQLAPKPYGAAPRHPAVESALTTLRDNPREFVQLLNSLPPRHVTALTSAFWNLNLGAEMRGARCGTRLRLSASRGRHLLDVWWLTSSGIPAHYQVQLSGGMR